MKIVYDIEVLMQQYHKRQKIKREEEEEYHKTSNHFSFLCTNKKKKMATTKNKKVKKKKKKSFQTKDVEMAFIVQAHIIENIITTELNVSVRLNGTCTTKTICLDLMCFQS